MRSLALSILLLSAPCMAQASDLDYNYIGAGWYGVHSDNFSNERGYALQGSWALGDHWIAAVDYRFNDGRFSDVSNWQFGVGYRFDLSERSDFIVSTGYLRYEVDGFINRDESAPFLELAARFDATPGFDWGLGLRHANLDGIDDLNLLADAQWKFGRWSLALEFSTSGDENTLMIGPRYRF